ncbi:hypothetical protein [Pengzhenrongella sicca]|uniref:Lipoprotein n=1 Tax=Pengzhenrongella sicca TaxID=2819238 RepID=A0A8A4ZFS8_9MICO|nr:hypothetical protein [Pengzhenrongella sicca]QTE30870.1 hypothetical protein J4E96_08060 [Pengzhenrongella sicca]
MERTNGGRRRAASAVLGATLIAGLTGCGAAPTLGAGGTEAQDSVVRLLTTTAMASYTADIDGFARSAVASSSGVQLIDIGRAGAGEGDVVGTLTLRVDSPAQSNSSDFGLPESESDQGPYCFEVVFDHWGKQGEFGTAEGVTHIECPPDASPITPPPSDLPVVAENAREAAHEVLAGLPASGLPSADEIASKVAALLRDGEVGGPPVAEVSAVVEGADVGIATGGADDCVLVARKGDAIIDVYPPSVYLQPGELGCGPYTALSDDLRPPH